MTWRIWPRVPKMPFGPDWVPPDFRKKREAPHRETPTQIPLQLPLYDESYRRLPDTKPAPEKIEIQL